MDERKERRIRKKDRGIKKERRKENKEDKKESKGRKEGRKERRKEARKEGTVSMEGSGGGALALRVHRPQSGSRRGGLAGGARRPVGASCMRVRLCVCRGTGKGTCVFGLCTVGSWVCAFMSVP